MLSKKFVFSLAVLACLVLATQMAKAEDVALWHMDEGAGTVAADSTANGYDLTITGTGALNYSWDTPGYGGGGYCVSIPPDADTWMYTNGIATDTFDYRVRAEFSFRANSVDDLGTSIMGMQSAWWLDFYTLGGFAMIVGAEGQYLRLNTGVGDLIDGEWHTIVAEFDGIPDADDKIWMRYFKDGALTPWTEQSWDATAPQHVSMNGTAHGSNFYIGTDWSNPPRNNLNYIGSIDEVYLSNVPEPATLSLLALGGLALLRKRKV